MKVVAINGSARKDGNTALLVREVLSVLEREGIETEAVDLAGSRLRGCTACYTCLERKDGRCSLTDDAVNDHIARMLAADAIILASPTYFSDVTAEMKALIDRAGMVCRVNGDLLRRKVGAGIAVARRGGSIHTFDTLNHFFLIGGMIVPGSSYWNLGFGKDRGDVARDEEALATMRALGENIAWLLGRLHG